jgi:cell division protein ZipA
MSTKLCGWLRCDAADGWPMMTQLRWALLILGVVFVVALAIWERRRPRQASGALELPPWREGGGEPPARRVSEPPLTLPEVRVREPLAVQELPVLGTLREEQPEQQPEQPEKAEKPEEPDEPDEPEMPVSEPTAQAPAADAAEPQQQLEPVFDDEDTLDDLMPIVVAEPVAAPAAPLPPVEPLVVDWPAEHERRILALRLVAPQRERFAGRSLRQALAAEGFLLGQFAIFHKPDDERRAMLSAASLTRPGTFDMETMDSQHYGGLSLFAVLPGPKPAPQTFDELIFAARNLNERLHGVLQDEQGTPLTPARVAQLREQLRMGAAS